VPAWAGCGAVRRAAFVEVGGFQEGYLRPSIEDIELGYRLSESGGRIRLAAEVQVRHLKRWTLASIVRTDVWRRGVPWTELLLERPVEVTIAPADRDEPVTLSGSLLDGSSWDIGSTRGAPLVINVWGSWCAPCVAEAPDLQAAWEDLQAGDTGAAMVGIDFREEAARGAANLRQFELAPRHRGSRVIRAGTRRFLSREWRPVRVGLGLLAAVHLLGLNAYAWQQRAALASILAANPNTILLDEPTRGLDYAQKRSLTDLLLGMKREGRTIIMATHDVELAAACADRAVLIAEGQIVVDGPARQVMSDSQVFSSQINKLFRDPRYLVVADVIQALGE